MTPRALELSAVVIGLVVLGGAYLATHAVAVHVPAAPGLILMASGGFSVGSLYLAFRAWLYRSGVK